MHNSSDMTDVLSRCSDGRVVHARSYLKLLHAAVSEAEWTEDTSVTKRLRLRIEAVTVTLEQGEEYYPLF